MNIGTIISAFFSQRSLTQRPQRGSRKCRPNERHYSRSRRIWRYFKYSNIIMAPFYIRLPRESRGTSRDSQFNERRDAYYVRGLRKRKWNLHFFLFRRYQSQPLIPSKIDPLSQRAVSAWISKKLSRTRFMDKFSINDCVRTALLGRKGDNS